MQLPKIALPTSKIVLPDSKHELKVRPMVGQEFEIMLLAKESEDVDQQISAIYELLDSVVVTPEDFKSSELSPIDFDYIFTQLIVTSYARSNVDTAFKCKQKLEDGKTCNNTINVSIDLNNDVTFTPNDKPFKSDYELGQYRIIIDRPNTSHILKPNTSVFDAVATNISKLVDTSSGQEWNFKGTSPDVTVEDRDKFIKTSIPSMVIKEIAENIQDSPRMEYASTVKCRKCGTVHNIKLRGFIDFFGYASPHTT